jgi:hypothetical protein
MDCKRVKKDRNLRTKIKLKSAEKISAQLARLELTEPKSIDQRQVEAEEDDSDAEHTEAAIKP